jgi:hypothetical protein
MFAAVASMLRDGLPYSNLSPGHSALRDEVETMRCLVRRQREPGSEVDARHAARSLLIDNL